MKILLEKIKKLEQLEKVADEAEARYTEHFGTLIKKQK